MILYRQCELQNGNRIQIAWLPHMFAKVGKTLKLKDEDGWRVAEVYSLQPYDMIREFERQLFPSLDT